MGEMVEAVPMEARLEREPRNIHDRNAIKVLVTDERFAHSNDFHIGYLPRTIAALYAPRLDTGTFPYRMEGRITEIHEDGTAVMILKRKPKHG